MPCRVAPAAFTTLLALCLAWGTAQAACRLQPIGGSFPVNISGKRALVTAKVNGTEEIFVLSSAAEQSSLKKQVATELGVPMGAPGGVGFGARGEVNYQVARVHEFTFFGVPLPNLEFMVWDAGAGRGAVAGVIGQNFLRVIGDAEYDFANSALRFWNTSGSCSRDQMAYWVKAGGSYSMIGIESTTWKRPIAKGIAYVNGVPIHVLFDTGTPVSVLSLHSAARVGVKTDDPQVKSSGETWIAPIASFKIGDEEIRNTQLRVGPLGTDNDKLPLRYGNHGVSLSFQEYLDEFDMLLGFDFFMSHRVLISYAQHQVYFSYNGGPIFNLSVQTLSEPPTGPQDAHGTAAAPKNDPQN